MESLATAISETFEKDNVVDVQQTTCCIVGGGPGGMLLALLLARRGVAVTLLESHLDFDRNFRGDTLHPALLEILDEIGLAERLHRIGHVKAYCPVIRTPHGPFIPIDFRRLNTRFPYIMLIPQEKFLDFLAEEAGQYPSFRLVMGANVQRLVEENGAVRGVRFRGADGWHEVRALLTVGSDGRFSEVRRLAGFKPIKTTPPVHILWFRLPKLLDQPGRFTATAVPASERLFAVLRGSTGEEEECNIGFAFAGPIGPVILFDRLDHWQMGYIFFDKDHYRSLRAAGVEAFRRMLVGLETRLAPHLEHLTDWHQLSLLSVEFSHCRRWYKPGLLLIGDAVHVMTPAAGAGIKYAMEDAVVAANLLAEPLKSGSLRLRDLAEVQRRRERPARLMQFLAGSVQEFVGARQPASIFPLRIPWAVRWMFRIPWVRDLPSRFAAFGLWRVHVQH
jgi:2-polyprenyl-6-methoxyphenol hydroxylase-like FAD-dependent oxidoreductase